MSDQPQSGSGGEPTGPIGGPMPPYPSGGQAPPPGPPAGWPPNQPSYPQGPPPSYPQGPPPSYPQGGYPQGPPPSYPQGPPPSYPQGPPGGYGGGYGMPGGYGGYGGYGAGGPSRQAYATFWPRVGGWIIDVILVGIVSSIVVLPLRNANMARINFTVTTTTNNQTRVHHDHFSFLTTIVEVLIVLLYTGLMVGSRRGQTVGMMAISARAVDATDGSPIGFWRAVARTAIQYPLAIVFVVPWVVDMLFPTWDARRQTLHDKMTRTVVVKTNAAPEPVWTTPQGGWGPG